MLGGTRGVGRALVGHLTESGHLVTVLARDPARMGMVSDALTVEEGDARDPAAVRNLAENQDAVCSCLGVRLSRGIVTLFSESTAHLLEAVKGRDARLLAIWSGCRRQPRAWWVFLRQNHPSFGEPPRVCRRLHHLRGNHWSGCRRQPRAWWVFLRQNHPSFGEPPRVCRRLHHLRGWGHEKFKSDIQQKYGSERFGWSWITNGSTARSGRRSVRSPRRSGVQQRRCVSGSDRQSGTRVRDRA